MLCAMECMRSRTIAVMKKNRECIYADADTLWIIFVVLERISFRTRSRSHLILFRHLQPTTNSLRGAQWMPQNARKQKNNSWPWPAHRTENLPLAITQIMLICRQRSNRPIIIIVVIQRYYGILCTEATCICCPSVRMACGMICDATIMDGMPYWIMAVDEDDEGRKIDFITDAMAMRPLLPHEVQIKIYGVYVYIYIDGFELPQLACNCATECRQASPNHSTMMVLHWWEHPNWSHSSPACAPTDVATQPMRTSHQCIVHCKRSIKPEVTQDLTGVKVREFRAHKTIAFTLHRSTHTHTHNHFQFNWMILFNTRGTDT